MEGAGLSVSLHPEEWREIARLGNEPLWILTKPRNKFLDFFRLGKKGLQDLRGWGIQQKLAVSATIYQMCYWDDEYEEERCFEFSTREEAEYEAEDSEGEIREVPGRAMPTNLLNKVAGFKVEPTLVDDMLAVAYAESVGLDGVWWEETLDPTRLSAPRGVIVPSQIRTWKIQRHSGDEINEIRRRAGVT